MLTQKSVRLVQEHLSVEYILSEIDWESYNKLGRGYSGEDGDSYNMWTQETPSLVLALLTICWTLGKVFT